VGCTPPEVRRLFEQHGLVIQEWDRVRTDWLTIAAGGSGLPTPTAGMAAVPALPTAPTAPAGPR
jgi:hypothetical protein